MFYTLKEKTEKRHDEIFIIAQARATLESKNRSGPMDVTALSRKSKGQLFTTEEASELVNEVVCNTIYGSR